MDEKEFNELKEKVAKLEKKRNFNLWLQFFIFPIILAGMGYFFQYTVKKSEDRLEQLKLTQTIVDQVFKDTTAERTVILRDILNEILDNDVLVAKIQKSIDNHLKNKAMTGTPEEAKKVTSAVNTFASNNSNLKESLNASEEIQEKISKYDRAIAKEREAFTHLVNGDLKNAKQAFKEVEEIYPSFHQAYGIVRYLEKAPQNPTAAEIKEIQNHIANTLNWKAPKDLIQRLQQ
ncbi:hypothetical protein [Kordia jejudonensis]|uniref:hypothetical protein n=1 Tax=Kordia jejudonensis TaxID=1348245 RepID=UPI0006298330|nr:hypothetical protein [Kordia jejudonensis]